MTTDDSYFLTIYRGDGYIFDFDEVSSQLRAKLSHDKIAVSNNPHILYVHCHGNRGFIGDCSELIKTSCYKSATEPGELLSYGVFDKSCQKGNAFATATYSKYPKVHAKLREIVAEYFGAEILHCFAGLPVAEWIFSNVSQI